MEAIYENGRIQKPEGQEGFPVETIEMIGFNRAISKDKGFREDSRKFQSVLCFGL